jgi:hypothetical protein
VRDLAADPVASAQTVLLDVGPRRRLALGYRGAPLPNSWGEDSGVEKLAVVRVARAGEADCELVRDAPHGRFLRAWALEAFLGLPFGQPPFLAFSLAACAFAGLLARPARDAITGPML